MTEDEAKNKICPLMSTSDGEVSCVASRCMIWIKVLKNGNKYYLNGQLESLCYYNGETSKMIVEGYCGILGDKPPFIR